MLDRSAVFYLITYRAITKNVEKVKGNEDMQENGLIFCVLNRT